MGFRGADASARLAASAMDEPRGMGGEIPGKIETLLRLDESERKKKLRPQASSALSGLAVALPSSIKKDFYVRRASLVRRPNYNTVNLIKNSLSTCLYLTKNYIILIHILCNSCNGLGEKLPVVNIFNFHQNNMWCQ